jgi:gliding motility-associated-like protein
MLLRSILFVLSMLVGALFMPVLWGQSTPVAHYPFDGDALDVSGNGNHGTPIGAELTSDRLGRAAHAYRFDGVDDYLTYENEAQFQPALPLTVATWLRLDSYQSNPIFYNNWRENVYLGIMLVCTADGQISVSFGDGGSIGPAARRSLTSSITLDLGAWYHVAAVIRSAEAIDLYLNGRKICGLYDGLGQELAYDGANGRSGQKDQTSIFNSPLDHFHGALDDLRLYDRALSSTEIRALLGQDPPEPLGSDTAICIFDTVNLPSPSANQYQWSPSQGLSCDDCPDPDFFPQSSTTYQLLTSTGAACQDTFRYRIEVADCCRTLAWEEVKWQDLSCHGQRDGQIEAQAQGGTPPYEFSLNGAPWGSEATFGALAAGEYQLRLRDAEGCVRDTTLRLGEPDPLRIILDSVQTVPCEGEPLGSIFARVRGGVAPFQTQVDGDAADWPLMDLAAGDYRLRVQDVQGCVDSLAVRVTGVDGLFTTYDQVEGPRCVGLATGQLRAQSEGGMPPYTYALAPGQWQNGPQVTGLQVGAQTLLTRDEQGCQIRQALRVEQSDTLQARAEVANHDLSEPILLSQATVQFANQSQYAQQYRWDFGYQGAQSLAIAPSFTYDEPGEYEVILTAYTATLQCQDRDTLRLRVVADGRIFLPNVFTPNRDGQNDRFEVRGEGLVSAQMVIYDRWGREVRRIQGSPLVWEGQHANGQAVPAGVYAYRLQATFNDGHRIERGGTVMVLR